jgi:hypothetical protein
MTASRRSARFNRVIPSGGALSDALDMSPFAAGTVDVPSAWTAAGLGFYHCATVDGTFQPLMDHTDTLVEIAALTVSESFELPPEIFSCRFIKLWSQTSASGVNQGADRTLALSLKS